MEYNNSNNQPSSKTLSAKELEDIKKKKALKGKLINDKKLIKK
jgi:hypothetical protein